MGQQILPFFIEGDNSINAKVSYDYSKDDGTIYYSLFCMPVYSHLQSDKRGFQIITSQLIVNGHCKNCEVIKAFGVTSISVKRAVKRYREGGIDSFFTPKATRKGNVLTDKVISRAQQLLNDGASRSDIAQELSLKINTLSKAIQAGKLFEPKKKL